MTGQFGEVDLDLLADFLGGALEGTSDETAVARLIADDPAWARAHAALAPAVARTQASLASWGKQPEPMPSDVADRLSTALARADALAGRNAFSGPAATSGGGANRSLSASPTRSDRTGPRLATTPGGARARPGEPARRRWARWVGPVAVAAAVAAIGGLGLSQLISGGGAQDNAETALSAGDNSGPQPATASGGESQPLVAPSTGRLLTTGRDYARASLAEAIRAFGLHDKAAAKSADVDAGDLVGRASGVPQASGLLRLADRAALATCLRAVTSAHNRGPIVVDLVDYASFEGSPAIVVSFVDQGGERWAWVVGPACGEAQSGADTRYSTRVG